MSLFEHVNNFSLNLISVLNRIFPVIAKGKKNKFILCYHSVGNTGWRFSVPLDSFKEQIEYLVNNFNILRLSDIEDQSKYGAVISFDDGYKDVYKNALPILEKHNIKAAMFVLGNLDKANRAELDNNLELLDLNEIRKLHDKGWEIGCHSATHADLGKLSEDELREEIIESKKMLESKLKFRIRNFAYPKGKYNKKIIKIVKEAGYSAAFTVDGGFINFKDKMLLTRIPTEGIMNINQFSALVSPLGIFAENIFMAILKRKESFAQYINKII